LNTFYAKTGNRHLSFGADVTSMGMAGARHEFYLIGGFVFFDDHLVMVAGMSHSHKMGVQLTLILAP